MPDLMIILKLFTSFLVIGLFSFGGGYSSLSIMEDMMVNKYLFLSKTEFWQVVAIAQVTPGPIALNCATYIGAKKAGMLGAIVSTFSVIFIRLVKSLGSSKHLPKKISSANLKSSTKAFKKILV